MIELNLHERREWGSNTVQPEHLIDGVENYSGEFLSGGVECLNLEPLALRMGTGIGTTFPRVFILQYCTCSGHRSLCVLRSTNAGSEGRPGKDTRVHYCKSTYGTFMLMNYDDYGTINRYRHHTTTIRKASVVDDMDTIVIAART